MSTSKQFILIVITTLLISHLASGQSRTTEKLIKKYEDAFNLFFYHNTLRMINQEGDKEFDELIEHVEKMRLLIVDKNLHPINYGSLKKDYQRELYEEIMTSRHDGKNFDLFIREDHGQTTAMLAMINGDDNIFILDILGRIPFEKVGSLFKVMDSHAEVGKKINTFIRKEEQEDN